MSDVRKMLNNEMQVMDDMDKMAAAKFGKLKKKGPTKEKKKTFDSGEYYLQQAKEKEAKEKEEAEAKAKAESEAK